MNKPQIINDNGNPKFIVLEYEDYLEMLEKIDDIDALNEYRKAKKKKEKFIPIEKVIQDLGLD